MVKTKITMIRFACALFGVLTLVVLAALITPGWLDLGGEPAGSAKAATPVAPAAKPKLPPPPQLPPNVAEVLRSGVLIVVSKQSQRMYVFKDGVPWATSPVSTGKRGHATPAGVFPILQKKTFHRSNLYSNAPMPFMQRLTWSGIAIHAGRLPGYPASHGCIRLPHAFAKSLFALTQASATTVVITNSAVKTDSQARTLALNTPMPRPAAPGAAPLPSPALAQATQPIEPKIAALPLVPVQPRVGGQTIQLAAAATSGEAETIWQQMILAHPELARFEKSVIPAVVGSRRVYRLRATAPDAHAYCASLKRAGGACFNVT